MADLEFFLDPVCPWAWITSRWITEVKQLRHYEVQWRFICLKMINEHRTDDWYTPEYRAGHMAGLYGLRVADQVRIDFGNEQVSALYTVLGEAIHHDKRRPEIIDDPVTAMEGFLKAADLPPGLAQAALDESHDAYIQSETALAFERTGTGRRSQLLRAGDRPDPARPGGSQVVGRGRDRRHDERHGRVEALQSGQAQLRLTVPGTVAAWIG
jgi:hypothetical protein